VCPCIESLLGSDAAVYIADAARRDAWAKSEFDDLPNCSASIPTLSAKPIGLRVLVDFDYHDDVRRSKRL
jgi:hypothetical protein